MTHDDDRTRLIDDDATRYQPTGNTHRDGTNNYRTTQGNYGGNRNNHGRRRQSSNPWRTFALCLIILVLVVGGIAAYLLIEHQNRQDQYEMQRQTEYMALQDSIAQARRIADERESERLALVEQQRRDSTENEMKMRFTAGTILRDKSRLRNDWEEALFRLGFAKLPKRLVESDITSDGYLCDVYTVPFTRTLNGRTIDVMMYYRYRKIDPDGEIVPEEARQLEWNRMEQTGCIIFSNSDDADAFRNTLLEMGFTGLGDKYESYDPDLAITVEFDGNNALITNEKAAASTQQ